MKKLSFILLAAAAMALALSGTAFANFGPHGGYAQDTDACAGCHRAHTSFSTATWRDVGGTDRSALLVSGATNMSEFCYACHGNNAPGAATNVQAGVFDSGPSADVGGLSGGVTQLYQTNSTFGAILNGGGFSTVGAAASTSMHNMDIGNSTDPQWGSGTSVPAGTNLTCTDCHDPHGSSNYRLLKDQIGSVAVGGYDASDTPDPFVISNEQGYPTVGWKKHADGAAQMTTYRPNYTTAEYRTTGSSVKSMSVWCAACHTQYNQRQSSYNYGTSLGALPAGARTYHRHPVDTSLVGGDPGNVNRALPTPVLLDPALPLEAMNRARTDAPDYNDYMGCLTCHRAHGTSAAMSGWARATLDVNGYPVLAPLSGGVAPNGTSALLRADNRGVCERCHNK